MIGNKSLITLAMVCLLAVPAYSMPWADGMGFGKGLCMGDLTEEELENMTLAEIKELKEQKLAELENMTLAEIQEMRDAQREERAQELENMTLAELKEQRQDRIGDGKVGCGQMNRGDMGASKMNPGDMGAGPANCGAIGGNQMNRGDVCCGQMNCGGVGLGPMGADVDSSDRPFFGGACLLMMDLSKEDLESMTLAEIKELKEQKIDEFNNMTAEEIEALKEQKLAEMENMTLAEIKEQFGMCGMAGFGGCQMDGQCGMVGGYMQQGRGADQFGKNGPVQGSMGAKR